jgi:hypothetical protein
MDRPLDRTYAAVVFDWDGTAVTDRRSATRRLRARVERLSMLGVHTAIVSGTHVGNVDGQLGARPAGPGELLLALNRGSELFRATVSGPRLLDRRVETPRARRLLDEAASRIASTLRDRRLGVEIVSQRINRRKIDLIPEPAWADPPKSAIAHLVEAVEARVRDAGFSSLAQVVSLATEVAVECGIDDPRVTSDAKHVEVGLTDKSDSMRTVMSRLADLGVGGELVLVVGDEFGPLGGVPGSDSLLLVPEAAGATVLSVGIEPAGVPPGVLHLGGGPAAFLRLLDAQIERARRLRVPTVSHDPRWTVAERGVDVERHRVSESLFTLTSGGVGLRGSVEIVGGPQHQITYTVKKRAYVQSEDEARGYLSAFRVTASSRPEEALVEGKWTRPAPRKFSAEIVIQVPQELELARVTTKGGDLAVRNIAGRVEGQSSGGNMQVSNVTGPISAQTGGGSVEVSNVPRELTLRTGGGAIKIHGQTGRISAETAGGNILVGSSAGAQLQSGGGSIQVTQCGSHLKANTVAGSIEVGHVKGSALLQTGGGNSRVGGAGGVVTATTGG